MEIHVKKIVTAVFAGVTIVAGGITLHQIYKILLRRKHASQRRRFSQEIQVIATAEHWEAVLHKVNKHLEIVKVLGIDCEWTYDCTHNHRRPVALLQVATPFGLCILIRLCFMKDDVPQSLKELMANQSILKVGVSVRDDGKKLLKDYGIAVQGCVDLRHLIMRVRNNYVSDLSLQGLAEGILGVKLDKRKEIRCSDWEANEFTPEQKNYAAADGQVGVDIFTKLVLTKLTGRDTGDLVWTLDGVDLTQLWKMARAMCQGIVDVGYKEKRVPGHAQTTQAPKKTVEAKTNPYTRRAWQLYHNCQLQAPDGQPLCTCNSKKAEWYIEKELGDKVCDNPLTVRLRFEPAGRPSSENDFYVQEKKNLCVVCGTSDNYTKKFVVPQEYRRYFPRLLKDHRSHDVLLLCGPCHKVSSNHDLSLRNQLAVECDAPLDADTSCLDDENRRKRIRSVAKTLKLKRDTIPEERVKVMEQEVLDFLNEDSITDEVLDSCINMESKIFNSEYMPHGKNVVEYFSQKGELWEFERRCRQHFVKTMNPQFLPPLWSVDHHHNGILSTY